MKKLTILLFFILATTYSFCQSFNDKIEIHLNLLQKVNAKGMTEYALGVSIINHSSEEIYIPKFEHYASYGGIHFYQKENGIWKEINIDEHDYYHLPTGGEPAMYFDKNSLEQQYTKYTYQLRLSQDSILKAVSATPDHNGLPLVSLKAEKPLFLKAKQEITNFSVRSLDYLSTKKMDYKITFNTEARDSSRYYRDSIVYSKRTKTFEKNPYPKLVAGYHLFYLKEIISNVIYFTPTTLIPLKN